MSTNHEEAPVHEPEDRDPDAEDWADQVREHQRAKVRDDVASGRLDPSALRPVTDRG